MDRRRYKRINYFASKDIIQECVLKSWKSVIQNYKRNDIDFMCVMKEGKEHAENKIHNIRTL